jgi:hypothetical protein
MNYSTDDIVLHFMQVLWELADETDKLQEMGLIEEQDWEDWRDQYDLYG